MEGQRPLGPLEEVPELISDVEAVTRIAHILGGELSAEEAQEIAASVKEDMDEEFGTKGEMN